MTLTLSTLRALLERAHGPGVEHLFERTLPEVARAYLPAHLVAWDGARRLSYDALHMLTRWSGSESLDLTDVGTVNAVKVALALALGLDPGVMGLGVAWRPLTAGDQHVGWYIMCARDGRYYMPPDDATDDDEIPADAIATEPDPIRALVAAVEHVLKESTDAR